MMFSLIYIGTKAKENLKRYHARTLQDLECSDTYGRSSECVKLSSC